MKNRNDISKLFIKSVITISLFLLLVISSNFRDLGKLSPIKTLKLHEIENDDDDDVRILLFFFKSSLLII